MIRYQPAIHQLVDTEIARFLRRRLCRNDIFTLRYPRTDRWGVAVWLNPQHTVFEGLLGMDSLAEFDRPCVEALCLWNEGKLISGKDLAQRIHSDERAADQQYLNDQAESLDIKQFIGRKIGSDHPEWQRPGLPHHMI